ncbi:MAG: hypothetical protein OK454_02560 [Thaumarchaeota archaeon]|nr:hypothetical protein [Nitrososphaerota archaeon]
MPGMSSSSSSSSCRPLPPHHPPPPPTTTTTTPPPPPPPTPPPVRQDEVAVPPRDRKQLTAGPPNSKGSMSFKGSNTRRESIARRAAMRLGGLRVITGGGVSAGADAALYLVSVMVSEEAAEECARIMQWTWAKGVVVDGLDV